MAVGNDPEVAERPALGFSPEDCRDEHARHNGSHNRIRPARPIAQPTTTTRQPADNRGESLCHSPRSVRKTPATSISIMRTMARVTRLSLFRSEEHTSELQSLRHL